MQDQLFTAHQAIALAGGPLPLSSRIQLQRMSGGHDITQNTFDPQFIRRILKQCKWNTIPVFKRKNNKQRLTLSITQEQLNPMIAQSLLNIQNDTKCLLPILMFDNAINTHWIEHVLIVHVQDDIDIGISLRCDASEVQITGIYLDKVMILEQHEVLLSPHDKHECHCLDGFTSIINDMRVGNCDALLNEMKNYKQKYRVFKQLALKFINGKDTEKYEILQKHAEMAVTYDNGSLGYSLYPDCTPSSPSSFSYCSLQSPSSSTLSSNSDNNLIDGMYMN